MKILPNMYYINPYNKTNMKKTNKAIAFRQDINEAESANML